ncbi:hypothetical protein AB4369_19140, partial [Vibrio sp. 10N.261.49.A5]
MRLTQFRVRNFRSINDSGFVTTEELTAILGRNESGKSNLLLALQHINPPTGIEDITPIKNFPRHRRLSEQTESTPFLDTQWLLAEDEREELVSIFPRAKDVSSVTISRYYSAKRYVGLTGLIERNLDVKSINRLIDKMITLLDSQKSESTEELINNVVTDIQSFAIKGTVPVELWLKEVESHSTVFRNAAQYLGDKEDTFYDLKIEFESIVESLDDENLHTEAIKFIISKLPV